MIDNDGLMQRTVLLKQLQRAANSIEDNAASTMRVVVRPRLSAWAGAIVSQGCRATFAPDEPGEARKAELTVSGVYCTGALTVQHFAGRWLFRSEIAVDETVMHVRSPAPKESTSPTSKVTAEAVNNQVLELLTDVLRVSRDIVEGPGRTSNVLSRELRY